MVDHYATLGIPRTATPDEIKRAYYRRARQTHPDHGGTAELFLPVSDAWEALREPDKRAAYDALLGASGARPLPVFPHYKRATNVHDLFDFTVFPKPKTKE